MKRFRASLPLAMAALAVATFAVSTADAGAKAKRHHGVAPRYESTSRRAAAFPVYVDHGSDRNPGGDNLYFTDTRTPHYVVGPAWFQRWEDR